MKKPHIVRFWVPRKGRFVWHVVPCIEYKDAYSREPDRQLMLLNREARWFCQRLNKKEAQ